MASSRKVSEERSIGETLVREFILGDVADTSASLASSQHLLRLLNEVQDDLSRHSASAYSSALQGHAGPERLSAVLAVAAAVSEARVLVADACYSELDVSVNALDRRLKLMEAVLKLHGQTLGEESANGVEEKMSEITRAPDAVSSRMRRRDPPAGSAAAGDAGAAAAAAAGAGGGATGATGALQQQLAAATGGGGGSGQSSSPSALDVAIGTFEPLYCVCQQVAFGEMVACDNENCRIEWFHYSCVGLSAATRPTSRWYCTACKASGCGQ